jgi:hypothetical protein
VTLSIHDAQRNNTWHKNWLCRVSHFSYCYAEHRYAECRDAECCYIQCLSARLKRLRNDIAQNEKEGGGAGKKEGQ